MQQGTISVPNFHGLADTNISARQKRESHRNLKNARESTMLQHYLLGNAVSVSTAPELY